MAHTFACLRIAKAISDPGARLATGSGGLTLGRAGFAPAGRQTKFHEVIASSFPFDPHCLVALFFLYSTPWAEMLIAVVLLAFSGFVEEVVGLVRHEFPLADIC